MGVVSRIRTSFWTAILGGIVLYAFFVALADVSPTEITWVSIAVAAMAVTFTIRNLRLSSQLARNPVLRQKVNRLRERRGF